MATVDPAAQDNYIYNRLLKERIIWLGSEVRDENANAICSQLLLLSAENPEKDIYLYINSPGGSVTAGMAIYDTMQFIPNDVVTVATGLAASMGQFLLSSGTKGKRYATPNARILMHQPSGGIGGTASDIKIQAELILHMKKVMAELTADQTGQTVETILKDNDRDKWFTAKDALEYGFFDKIAAHAGSVAGGGGTNANGDTRSHRELTGTAMNSGAMNMNYNFGSTAGNLPSSRYVLPQFEERTPYGFKRQDPYTKLFEDRIIFLGVQVDDASADDVMAQLLVLESTDPDRDITLYINSPGGSFTAMTAIYDTMTYIRPEIQTVCLGQAASAAAVLLAAGTPGKRLALPNARVLIHQPSLSGGQGGQASDLEIQAAEVMRMRSWLEDTLAKHSGRTPEQVNNDIERDKILTAAEAMQYGLIDQVLDSRKIKPQAIAK